MLDILPILLFVSLLGAIFGSFASVLVHRIRTEENGIALGRSHCPACGHTLAWYDLLPLVSWLSLGGKCRYCQTNIPSWYPLIEVSMAGAFLLMACTFAPVSRDISEFVRLGWFLAIAFVIVIVSAYDLRFREIPDEVLLPSILLVLLVLGFDTFSTVPIFSTHFAPLGDSPFWNVPLANGFLGAWVLYTFLYAQIFIPALLYGFRTQKWWVVGMVAVEYITFPALVVMDFFHRKRGGKIADNTPETDTDEYPPTWVGYGDLRIAVFIGLVAGLKVAALGMWLGYLVGSLIAIPMLLLRKPGTSSEIAFGPFLGVGLLLALVGYRPIVETIFGFLSS